MTAESIWSRAACEDLVELLVGDVGERAPGVDLGGEAGLALEDVADARGEALVEEGVAEGPGRVGGAEDRDQRVEVEVRGEDVGAEAGEGRVDADAARGQDAQGRAAELDRVVALAGEHRPGRGARPAPARPLRVDVPAAAHPQVAVEDEVAEVEDQVLAVGVDPLQRAAVEAFDPGRAPARIGRRDRDRLADQGVGEPVLRAQDRVALGHASIITRRGPRLPTPAKRQAPRRLGLGRAHPPPQARSPRPHRRARDRRRAGRDRRRRDARHPAGAEGPRLRSGRHLGPGARPDRGRPRHRPRPPHLRRPRRPGPAARGDRRRRGGRPRRRDRLRHRRPRPGRGPRRRPRRALRRRRGARRRLGAPPPRLSVCIRPSLRRSNADGDRRRPVAFAVVLA